jgi:hypothetical protein
MVELDGRSIGIVRSNELRIASVIENDLGRMTGVLEDVVDGADGTESAVLVGGSGGVSESGTGNTMGGSGVLVVGSCSGSVVGMEVEVEVVVEVGV